MLSLFSWGSNLSCDKFQTPNIKMFGCKATPPNTPYQPKVLKRKYSNTTQHLSMRGGSDVTESTETTGNAGLDEARASPPLHESCSMPLTPETCSGESQEHDLDTFDHEPKSKSTSEARLRKTKQIIQTQLNLEILHKHQELRLIDQELAKCQIVLEQLRRCSEIPYPSTRISEDVSVGTGPALRRHSVKALPQSPAPWGVTDGPYSRHYARWLVPDAQFDGEENDYSLRSTAGKAPSKSRMRGGNVPEPAAASATSRSQRSGKLTSLPAGYGQPKEKASGPLILRRKSDGAMVKLVCPDCTRLEFGSAQGFINHCRIGHQRHFASHEEAAEKCGEAIKYDEAGAVVVPEAPPTPVTSNVHHLIRNAHKFQHNHGDLLPGSTSTPTAGVPGTTISPEFKASTATPNLSTLVQSRGLGLNLQDLVMEAKTKVELAESDGEDDLMDETPVSGDLQGRHPQVAGSKHPISTKSAATPPLLNTRLPVSSANLGIPQTKRPAMRGDDGSHASSEPATPLVEDSPTVEFHQAPSLVDDEEEYEAHSPTSSSLSDHDENDDVEFAIHDDEHETAHVPPSEATGCNNSTPTPLTSGHRRRPSAIRRNGAQRDERHVTFVSPSPARDTTEPKAKRRRLNTP